MPTARSARIAVITIVVFLAAGFSYEFLSNAAWFRGLPRLLRWLSQPLWWTAWCVAALMLTHGIRIARIPAELGIRRPILSPLAFGLAATAPMWLGAILLGCPLNVDNAMATLFMAGVWPFGEELLFRGYAFHQLHRRAGMGLWTAAITTGVVFGVGHLCNATVQGMPLAEQLGTIAIISAGGLGFAWVFARWDDNLWVPFALHAFMNLWWEVFSLGDNPLGGVGANVMRFLTVLLAIHFTIRRGNRRSPAIVDA